MPTASTIPAALDVLVAAVRLAAPQNVLVLDGPPPTSTTPPDIIAIGFNGEPGTESVTAVRTGADVGGFSDSESYDIASLASSWRGDNDQKLVRDIAFGFVDLVAAELARDQTLGATVARAYLSVAGVAPLMDSKGAMCTARFVIHVDAFT